MVSIHVERDSDERSGLLAGDECSISGEASSGQTSDNMNLVPVASNPAEEIKCGALVCNRDCSSDSSRSCPLTALPCSDNTVGININENKEHSCDHCRESNDENIVQVEDGSRKRTAEEAQEGAHVALNTEDYAMNSKTDCTGVDVESTCGVEDVVSQDEDEPTLPSPVTCQEIPGHVFTCDTSVSESLVEESGQDEEDTHDVVDAPDSRATDICEPTRNMTDSVQSTACSNYRGSSSPDIPYLPEARSYAATNISPDNSGANNDETKVSYHVQGARPKEISRSYNAASWEATDGGACPEDTGLSDTFLARHSADTSLPYYSPMEESFSHPSNQFFTHRGVSSSYYPIHLGLKGGSQVDNSTANNSTQMYPPQAATRTESHITQGPRTFSSHWQATDPPSLESMSASNLNQNFDFTVHQEPMPERLASPLEEISGTPRNGRPFHFDGSAGHLPRPSPDLHWSASHQSDMRGSLTREEVRSSFSASARWVGNLDNVQREGSHTSASTDSAIGSTDNSILSLEMKIAQACTLVERVLREREERAHAARRVEQEREARMRAEARARIEREERERRQQQEEQAKKRKSDQCVGKPNVPNKAPVQESPRWLCEHYQRRCKVRFPCCGVFYPCHRCHNGSGKCSNEVKALKATHLQCVVCKNQQEVNSE